MELQTKRQLTQAIHDRWMACYTQQEIAEITGASQPTVTRKINEFIQKVPGNQMNKFEDSDFRAPLYNVWRFNNKTNEVSHFGIIAHA